MKRMTLRRRLYLQRRAFSESKRRKRKRINPPNSSPHRGRSQKLSIPAPVYLDIYTKRNYRATTEFLQQLRKHASKERILICFRDTKKITAAAGLLLIAEVDRLVSKYGRDRISCTLPPTPTLEKGVKDNTVDAVLSQIGFYELIGKKRSVASTAAHVICWQYESGLATHGEAAGKIIEKISKLHPTIPIKTLYRGCIEAMANCVEHAYIGQRDDGLNIDDKRWWLFAAVMKNKLTVLICDLGVGIPNTIQINQDESILTRIFQLFGFQAETDSGWIKTATLVKETRTQSGHRGKGGGDIRSLVQQTPSSSLTIFSNRGKYIYHSTSGSSYRPEILTDDRNSILGTIVEWSIPVTGEA